MRSKLTVLLLVAGCGPSTSTEQMCTREDIVSSGALVTGRDRQQCSPCEPENSHVLITLETTCEAGVEWDGSPNFIRQVSAVNLETQERFVFETIYGMPAETIWRVAPDEPLIFPGPRVDFIVTEPGDYEFLVELSQELMAAEFEGSIE